MFGGLFLYQLNCYLVWCGAWEGVLYIQNVTMTALKGYLDIMFYVYTKDEG